MPPDDYPSIAERRRLGVYVSDIEARVAEQFGEDVARRLMVGLGGQTVLLPRQPFPDHAVARAAGLPVLAWLIDHYGPARLYIALGPLHSGTQQDVRLRRAIMAHPGATNAAIAQAAGCSERAVRRRRAAMRAAGLNPPPAAPMHRMTETPS